MTAAGELATGTVGGNSPGSFIASREAAPPGVRSPTRASAVSKTASNWGKSRGGGDAWGRLRRKAEAESRLELALEFMADVGWWR